MPERIVPRFTCICATHHRSEVLPEAIESFVRQTYPHRELIVLDDANQYPPQQGEGWRLVPFPHRFKNIGEKHDYAIRNLLSKNTNCIAIWDDDDIHLPNRLEVLAEILAQEEVAICNRIAFRFSDRHIELIPAKDNHFHFGAYRLQAYYEVGGYSPLHAGEDKDLALRLFRAGMTFGKTDEIVQLYRWSSPYAHLATAKTADDYPSFRDERQHQQEIRPYWKENYSAIIETVVHHDEKIRQTASWLDHAGETVPVIDPERFSSVSMLLPKSDLPGSMVVFKEGGIRTLDISRPSRLTIGMLPTALENGRSVTIKTNKQGIGEVRYPGQVIPSIVLPGGKHRIAVEPGSKLSMNPIFVACAPIAEPEPATEENTVIVSVAAWNRPECYIEVFSRSANRFEIPVELVDYGQTWQSFYINKIIRMQEVLTEFRDQGKKYAFILDCRDLAFTAPLWNILARFNGLNDGRVLFGRDLVGCVWPCQSIQLLDALQESNGLHAIPCGGTIAGDIDKLLEFYRLCTDLHDELKNGSYRRGILQNISGNILPEYLGDDQFFFQIAAVYYPELIRVDIDKVLFATFADARPDLSARHWEDPRKNGSVNFAPILHSPWVSRNLFQWRSWAEKNDLLGPPDETAESIRS